MNRIQNWKTAAAQKNNSDYSVNSLLKTKSLVHALLQWFSTNARDLPWRRTCDPYAIWVSEIMLQQTQVNTVIPYWERWIRELPTIENLAKAGADKIHKLWEGLGYYTRVRNMQKAAQQIVALSRSRRREEAETLGNPKPSTSLPRRLPDCEFPDTFDAVLALPGIGRYTAGAICSIAFNQPTPILDGNVIRVLTRVYGITTDPREKQTNAQLWQLAEELVEAASEQKGLMHDERRPKRPPLLAERAGVRAVVGHNSQSSCSHLNQSLMELGALVCTPRSPSCPICPVHKLCVARKENLQDQLPNIGKRRAATERRFIAFVVKRNGKFLVRQRPEGVVNAHLWEFPNVEVTAAGRARQSSARRLLFAEQRRAQSDAPYQPNDFRPISTKPLYVIKHSITRYRITLEAWRAELVVPNGTPVSDPARIRSSVQNTPGRRPALPGEWRTLTQLHRLAFTSAHKKILANLNPSGNINPAKTPKATDDRALEK